MKLRSVALVLLAVAVLAGAVLAFCSPQRLDDPARDAEYYALDIVFCEEQVKPCAEVTSSSLATVFANVVAEKDVATLVVQLETDSPVLGTIKHEEFYVRRGETYSESLELSRSAGCRALPCTVSVTVYIQYEPILTESITFV